MDIEIETTTGEELFFVNVYEIERLYGGPEEGGWWYDTGHPVKCILAKSKGEAFDILDELREEYPDTGRSQSVLGGEDWRVAIQSHPARMYPEVRPHYE